MDLARAPVRRCPGTGLAGAPPRTSDSCDEPSWHLKNSRRLRSSACVEDVRKFFAGANERPEHGRIGVLVVHTLTTPVIEVAGDGQTAQSVWISPGVETIPVSQIAAAVKVSPAGGLGEIWVSDAADPQDTTEIWAQWAWVKYGIDFVQEDGHRKFWHYHAYRIFSTSHDKSGVRRRRHHGAPLTEPADRSQPPASVRDKD